MVVVSVSWVKRSVAFLVVFAPLPVHAGWLEQAFVAWTRAKVIDRISVSGTRTLGFHSHRVDGDLEAFNSLNYSGMGAKRFTDVGNVNIVGRKVLDVFNFNIQLTDSRFRDPQARTFSLDYQRGPLEFSAGDIRGRLTNSNRLIPFAKTLQGVMAGYRSGRLDVRAVRSEAKGSPRTVSVQGNNTAGPYYLQTSQVVAGSEQVEVDGVAQRLGEDYTITYELGAITFVGKVIPPTSSIVVTFEAFGFNAPRGTIQGAGATYDLGKFGRFGVTAVEQKAKGSGALSTRTELFQGFGAPSTPYFLEFEPMPGRPIAIRLDGVLQTENVDYAFDTGNPAVFYFSRFVAPTSTIEVVYTPKPTATVDGDREVVGLDYRLPVGELGFVSYSQATGRLKNPVNPTSGTARSLDANLTRGPWKFRANARDIPDGYVSVESRSFNRNEKATDFGVDYESGGLTYGLSHRNASVFARRVDSQGNVLTDRARVTELRASTSVAKDENNSWRLEHVRSGSNLRGQETKIATTELSGTRNHGRLRATYGIGHQDGRGPVADGNTTKISTVSMETLRLNLAYQPSADTSLSARTSFSFIRADGESGKGNDVTLAATYNPGERFNANASYGISRSGEIATLGRFQGGSGIGYGGNGFSGGAESNAFNFVPADLTFWNVAAQYRLSQRAGIEAFAYNRSQSGSVTSNTDNTTYGFAFDYDLGKQTNLYASFDTSNTSFFGTDQRSTNQTLNLVLTGVLPGRLSYRAGVSVLLSSKSTPFAQDATSFDLGLMYRLSPRSRALLNAQVGRTRNYLPQDDRMLSVGYQYQIYRNIALIGWYRFRDLKNLDPSVNSGAYRSRGFDLELSFTFR